MRFKNIYLYIGIFLDLHPLEKLQACHHSTLIFQNVINIVIVLTFHTTIGLFGCLLKKTMLDTQHKGKINVFLYVRGFKNED